MKYRKRRKEIWVDHVDYDWIDKKINGHGGCYSFNSINGRVIISYIYSKNTFQLFYYNIILFIKYLKRKLQVIKNG